MNRALEYSFKARVRNIARARRISPDELWKSLVLERFLVRVARSPHADHFVLKGGFLLSNYLNLGRHTQDIDFLVQRLSNEVEHLQIVLNDIISVPVDDQFQFSDLTVRSLQHPHMRYTGARARMLALFGKTRFKVIVDLGYEDIVFPTRRFFPLIRGAKGPLIEGEVEVSCYPKEFIFAEKLEATVFLGAGNSRMKDFHDLYKLTTDDEMLSNVENIVEVVFTHRGTSTEFPLHFDDHEYALLQPLWKKHTQTLAEPHSMPEHLASIIHHLNSWLEHNTSLLQPVL